MGGRASSTAASDVILDGRAAARLWHGPTSCSKTTGFVIIIIIIISIIIIIIIITIIVIIIIIIISSSSSSSSSMTGLEVAEHQGDRKTVKERGWDREMAT